MFFPLLDSIEKGMIRAVPKPEQDRKKKARRWKRRKMYKAR